MIQQRSLQHLRHLQNEREGLTLTLTARATPWTIQVAAGTEVTWLTHAVKMQYYREYNVLLQV